jgi:hypothetical protein
MLEGGGIHCYGVDCAQISRIAEYIDAYDTFKAEFKAFSIMS